MIHGTKSTLALWLQVVSAHSELVVSSGAEEKEGAQRRLEKRSPACARASMKIEKHCFYLLNLSVKVVQRIFSLFWVMGYILLLTRGWRSDAIIHVFGWQFSSERVFPFSASLKVNVSSCSFYVRGLKQKFEEKCSVWLLQRHCKKTVMCAFFVRYYCKQKWLTCEFHFPFMGMSLCSVCEHLSQR